MGRAHDPGADAGRPRVLRRDRRHGQRGPRPLDRRPRLRRGAHHLRPLPQLPRRPPPPVPQHPGRRREPARLLRGVHGPAGLERVPPAGRHLRRDRLDPRPARQCDARGAVLQRGRRGRADHRRRPDRHHGRRDRALHRRAPRRRHRRQRLPAGSREADGRLARAQRVAREARGRDARPRHGGRLRRRPRDVRAMPRPSATCCA